MDRKCGSKKINIEQSKLLTKISTLGAGTKLPVVLERGEILKLIGIALKDLKKEKTLINHFPKVSKYLLPKINYFEILPEWFNQNFEINDEDFIDIFLLSLKQSQDFSTYLNCLSELHKRRKKYSLVLASQPLPTMIQVAPRSLIEYGNFSSLELSSLLTWRKFFYDLDNRAAQETGYLFEPILAAAIGGQPKSAKEKVVRRVLDPSKGRQVDCWKVDFKGKPLAYEFKLRVTIAASGQGRFKEELEFAEDCMYSGVTPVLLVLDPTPNQKLSELQTAFLEKGGFVYVGSSAWEHIEEESGETMACFIEKYVRKPIEEITLSTSEAQYPLPLSFNQESDSISIKIGESIKIIKREV